jgi:hypothetical protein
VDRGKVIRQGPISELLAGTSVTLQVDCSSPDQAQLLIAGSDLRVTVAVQPSGLAITLPAGTEREVIAEVARVLISGGISVYRLQPMHTSLESWFLQVTSRLGQDQ